MKKSIIYISIGLFLASCGEKTIEDYNKELAELETQVVQIKAKIKELNLGQEEVAIVYPAVSVVPAQKKVFEHFFEIQGAIDSKNSVVITPESGGQIKSIRVKEGQFVAEGTVIATFDRSIIDANKNEIEEGLATAKYMYDKQKALMEKGVGTELAFKQAEGSYKSLLKKKKTIEAQESKLILKAPIAGYIEEVFSSEGSVAGPGTPIVRLVTLEQLSVKSDISEVYLKRLNKNCTVNLYFPALDVVLNDLPIDRIGKFVNPVNRTVVLNVTIPNPTDKMAPNLMVVMDVRDYIDTSAVVIPSGVILKNSKQKSFVFVLNDDNTVSERIIKTGMSYKNETEILEGLQGDEKIIERGARKIVDGDRVEVR